MKKALLTCPKMIARQYLQELEKLFQFNAPSCKLEEAELIGELGQAELLIMGGLEKITLNVLQQSRLKDIIFIGIQWETAFTPEAKRYCEENNIRIFATKGGGIAVARTTVEEILQEARTRQFFMAKNFVSPLSLGDILGVLKVTVIGAGGIGAAALNSLCQFGCGNLAYVEVMGPKKELDDQGIRYIPNLADGTANLKEAFSSDIISIHAPFIEGKTENMVKKEHLDQMRPNGLFINNARSRLVEPAGLLEFLSQRPDAKVITDEYYLEGEAFEKLSEESNTFAKIVQRPNFFLTGHTAAMRPESYQEYGQNLMKIIQEQKLA